MPSSKARVMMPTGNFSWFIDQRTGDPIYNEHSGLPAPEVPPSIKALSEMRKRELGILTSKDSIDDIEIESEDDGLYLVLEGDFVSACEAYLQNEEATTLKFRISTALLEGFISELMTRRVGWR